MKKGFGIRLSDECLAALKTMAVEEGRSVSDIIRRIIDEEIKKKSEKKKTDSGEAERTA
jgi:hypothetical protein